MKKIGFDFDKVFVNYPPLVPDIIVEKLYKKNSKNLAYRIPGSLEQKIRILSHHTYLRAPMKDNIQLLSELKKSKKYKLYLLSSRFSFLKKRTDSWIKKNNIAQYFEGLYFNYEDKQPHEFKEEIINKLKLTDYIDDDIDALLYLAKKNPDINFYWLNPGLLKQDKILIKNLKIISSLKMLEKYLI